MPQNQLEIPQELRHLAEENVERARQLYLQFMDGVEQTMAVWSAPRSDLISPGFDEVRERATKFITKTPMQPSNRPRKSPTQRTCRNCSASSRATCSVRGPS